MAARRDRRMNHLQSNYTTAADLKALINIVDVIGEVVSLTRKGNRYWGLCPFHDEKTPSFSVNPDKQLYYCFGCHEHGDVYYFAQRFYRLSGFKETKNFLAARNGITIQESPEARKAAQKAKQKREEAKALNTDLESLAKKARLDCFNISHWIYLIRKHITGERDLERQAVIWALENRAYIDYLADTFASGSNAEQLQASLAFRRWQQSQTMFKH